MKHINDTAGTNYLSTHLFKGKLNFKKAAFEYFNLKTSVCSPLTAAISSSVPSETSLSTIKAENANNQKPRRVAHDT